MQKRGRNSDLGLDLLSAARDSIGGSVCLGSLNGFVRARRPERSEFQKHENSGIELKPSLMPNVMEVEKHCF